MKNKYATIGIILTTLILAGVAIFTAIRLYQTRTQPVAPNVPSSKPAAATICGGIAGTACPAGQRCVKTEPYPDATGVCEASLVNDGGICGGIAGTACPVGQACIYSDGTTRAPFPDASGTCRFESDKSPSSSICSLSFNITSTPSPSPTPTATPTKSPSPTPTPTKSPSPSPTASPVPQCNTSCTSSSQCLSGMTCYIPNGSTSGNCRKTSCLTESDCICATVTPSPTPTASPSPSPTASPVAQCNSTCTSNSNCPSSMICYIPSGSTAGNCRNSQCLSETDCLCATTTTPPTTTPTYVAEVPSTDAPSLPDAGTAWPTILGTGFGVLVIIASLFLAL